MVHQGIESFSGRNVLFLQGPVGPFFKRFARDLETAGATVFKINFNGGDKYFFSSINTFDYQGGILEWPDFLEDFIESNRIESIVFFGDCREYHRIAHMIAERKKLEIGVFEEGYVRPDYVTFEEFGVNGHSLLSKQRDFYEQLDTAEYNAHDALNVGNTFWYAAWWAFLYYWFSFVYASKFRKYHHHRPLQLIEIIYWIRSIWRKWWYKYLESDLDRATILAMSKGYYLVPLQISTDAQVREHSDFSSVENFIEKVISSFSAFAPTETILLIKHHPLDRGYHDYKALIHRLAVHYNVVDRIRYIHDQHLPTLLENARGVVVINSTVGLSAIHHNTPIKACGNAIYDFEGLTYQGTLENFWSECNRFHIDRNLYERFRGYVIVHKQINGSFYKKIPESSMHSGIIWSK